MNEKALSFINHTCIYTLSHAVTQTNAHKQRNEYLLLGPAPNSTTRSFWLEPANSAASLPCRRCAHVLPRAKAEAALHRALRTPFLRQQACKYYVSLRHVFYHCSVYELNYLPHSDRPMFRWCHSLSSTDTTGFRLL